MATHSVNVSNISPATSETHLRDFFSFCGKIEKIDFSSNDHTATIHFEKPSAAKTATMLNGGTLDANQLVVTSEVEHKDEEHTGDPTQPIQQTDKPRAGIAAEYLARGYVLSDTVLKRAIEIDTKQGISSRFLSYLKSVDKTVGAKTLGADQTVSGKVVETFSAATEQARAIDEQKGYSKATGDYYTQALASPMGARVRDFYTSTTKQVLDIHEEARRIAAQKAGSAPPATATDATPAPAAT
ncbi:hypothetical protein DFH07DRAFT_973382 [Mycena maculata]|uniref:RRM domain-containing protein n=1 Tax=Mycena maculata TaxID=230809 RepID=A0AAD7MHR5_9AGAR|nr:hypothetical protein DFH07DRAFT_973382 [Mycena maculata]